jgi:integrase
MANRIIEMHKLRDGRLHLFKGDNSRFWMCRTYIAGKYKVSSTKETTFASAKRFAVDWHDGIKFRWGRGEDIHSHTFEEAAQGMLSQQKLLTKTGERHPRHADEYKKKVGGVLLPFFSKIRLHKITTNKIEDFKKWRIAGSVGGTIVSQATIHQDFVVLRKILKYAYRQEWIKKIPDFPENKIKLNPRGWFDKQEWEHLLKVSNQRIKNARGKRVRWEREQLHDFCIFCVHSGLRQGELLNLTYQDVEVVRDKKNRNKDFLRLTVYGKTGQRRVIAMMGAVRAHDRLYERNSHNPTDHLFPKNHRDGLNELLEESGLKFDRMGRTRNSKSFRHTYIMTRILTSGGRADVMKIARNCGVSPIVIDKHYASHLTPQMVEMDLIHIEGEMEG